MTAAADAAVAPRHRFWVPPEQIDDAIVRFSPGQAHQMASVLRLKIGERVRAFDGSGEPDYVVQLTLLRGAVAEGTIVGACESAPEPVVGVDLYAALLQRDKFEVVLQKAVEVGARSIVPVLTERSIVRGAPDATRRERWQNILREAAEQCGRGIVPRLGDAVPLSEALASASGEGPVLFAQQDERSTPLRTAVAQLPSTGRLSLFVGPEGGFAPEETALARSLDATVVSLGARTMRAETAAPVLVALLVFTLGERAGEVP